MVSQLDTSFPADGQLVSKALMRAQQLIAANEISALQLRDEEVRNALGLAATASLFPDLGGNFTPSGSQNLPTILLALDAGIQAAINAGGGGPISLASITDILSPTDAQRAAFQEPAQSSTLTTDFAFDEGSQAGRFLTVDNALQPITMTLPDASSLAREDGYLCSISPTSGANFAAITAPADQIRIQGGIQSNTVTQTTVFVGLSRALGFREVIHIFKDGPLYVVDGRVRITETDNLGRNAPQSIPGSALIDGSLTAGVFPALLNLGGTPQTGGSRSIVRNVGGNTTLVQSDSGNIVRLTGASAASWDFADLPEGVVIEIRSSAGGGEITLSGTGALPIVGGLTLPSGASGAIRFFNDEIEILGTDV